MKGLQRLLWKAYPRFFRKPKKKRAGRRYPIFDVSLRKRRTLTKEKFREIQGILRIRATFGNTHLNLTDLSGKTLVKLSAGSLRKNKRLKKSSPFTGILLSEEMARLAVRKNILRVWVILSGFGKAHRTILRGLRKSSVEILALTVDPQLPHNGCRPRREKRL